MPVIVVDDDKVLRFVHVLLDPDVPPERAAALADFLSIDIKHVGAWIDTVRAAAGALYPATVRMVPDQDALRGALADADALVVEGSSVGKARNEGFSPDLARRLAETRIGAKGLQLLTLRLAGGVERQ